MSFVFLLCSCVFPPPGTTDVQDWGADSTGKRDSTAALTRAHATGQPVYYPNGTYRFNGPTLNLAGGIVRESEDGVLIRNDLAASPVIVWDDDGNLVGLQHNHLEEHEDSSGPTGRITSGALVRPPLSVAEHTPRADLLAHWYNDFGTEYRRTTGSKNGWIGWYDWSWNFHGSKGGGYDPARHPLLGFYRGDNATVLDWQCYWLREYGVAGVILCHSIGNLTSLKGWEKDTHYAHWVWQLFTNAPNFRGLKYVMYAPTPWLKSTPENQQKVENAWSELVDIIYTKYTNAYVLERDGKRYPVLFLWAEEAVRGIFDNYNGSTSQLAFYRRMAERFRSAGWDGMALLARQQTSAKILSRDALLASGIVHLQGFYGTLHTKANTYEEYVKNYAPPAASDIATSVVTSHHTHAPHPSKWICPGHSPKQFEQVLRKAVNHIDHHRLPKIISCYNVAEWAEGGPGLQPNMQDRFGYLEAVRHVLVE